MAKKKGRGKKIALCILIVILLIPVIFFIIFSRDILTAASVKKVSDGIYTMNCSYDYRLDALMQSDISSLDDLNAWATENLFYNISVDSSQGQHGCSSFSGTTPEGHHLFGRNYDWTETDCMVIYSHPSGGYASIGLCDLSFIGMAGRNASSSPDGLYGKIASRYAPYTTVDGMNEAGLGVSILALDRHENHQDNGKPDMLIQVAIRALLDRCATVSEAVDLLGNYDIHMTIGTNFHLFLTDSTGRSAVVEWLGNDMLVTDSDAVTNYVLGDPDYYLHYTGDGRYETITECLDTCGGLMTRDEAMDLLSQVTAQRGNQTEWSCVYDLDDFTAYICFDTDFENVLTFNRDSFN